MVRKSDIYKIFKKFRSWAERQTGKRIQAIQTDNPKEYIKLGERLAELGISHRLAAPYFHQQMGTVERRHRRLIDTTVTLLRHSGLPNEFWDFGVLTASYLYNRNSTPILNNKSPMEVLFKKLPEYKQFKFFGCVCYPCLRPYRNNKLNSKSVRCIFVGYSMSQNSYLCLEPESRRIYASRDVIFNEKDFTANKQYFGDQNNILQQTRTQGLQSTTLGLVKSNNSMMGRRVEEDPPHEFGSTQPK